MFRKLFVAGACLFAIGCYYDSQEALYNNVTPIPCTDTNFTYAGKIAAIINENCSNCHSTTTGPLRGNGIILDTHSGLQEQVAKGKLMGDINQSPGFNAMPPNGGKVDHCSIADIQHWVDMNTPDN